MKVGLSREGNKVPGQDNMAARSYVFSLVSFVMRTANNASQFSGFVMVNLTVHQDLMKLTVIGRDLV